MVVSILLAYLDRIGERRHFKDVLWGVGAAMGLAAVAGVGAYLTIHTYAGSRVQTIFETVTFLLAAVLLTYMTFWMRNHGRTLSSDLRQRTDEAISGGARRSMSLLAFQAVGREGVETVVFTLAIAFSASAIPVLAGGAAGLVVSLALSFMIYRLGKRMNLALFFKVIGAVLMVFAAGLLVDATQNLQELGWLPLLTHPLWNTSRFLAEDSTLGGILHSFFGYASKPTVLQAFVWLAYLGVTVTLFLGLHRRPTPTRTTR